MNDIVTTTIDGTKDNITGHFANVYERIYNSIDDKEEVAKLYSRVNKSLDSTLIKDVDLITTEKIRVATFNLKSNRNDPLFMSSSQKCTTSCIWTLEIFNKNFLIHSHVSNVLLLATLIPIPKDKLGDLTSSNNYRSIALSSLILKIFDCIIILLFGETLSLDNLQFSYQKDCPTTMCTWMVIESISYFTRNVMSLHAQWA